MKKSYISGAFLNSNRKLANQEENKDRKRADRTLVFDFTLGTHPISTKGTTELVRSEATKRFWFCLH
jgi:hypothetical protein